MARQKLVLLLLSFMLLVSFASVFLPTVKGDTSGTLTFSATSSDGSIYQTSTNYGTARNSSSGGLVTGTNYLYVGQVLSGSDYVIDRTYLFFDTSAIPDTATITAANVSLYMSQNSSDTDFNITIQTNDYTFPHDPLQVTDYYHYLYNLTDGGSRNSSEYAAGYWTIEFTNLTWIRNNAYTKLVLRSSNDIDNIPPTGNEYVVFYAYEQGSGYVPKLTVSYTVPAASEYGYTLYGPFDEETGLALDENVTVGVWSVEGGAYTSFEFNQSYGFNTTTKIQFFQFNFTGGGTREYWVDPSEGTTAAIYVFKGDTTSYVINFLDTAGILKTYPYITAQRYVNGTLYTVEKRKIDVYNSVLMNLIAGRTYTIKVGNELSSYVFGDLLMTGTTSVQLTLRAVDFPMETLLQQKYVRVYSYRNYSASPNTITVLYEDTKHLTESVAVVIQFSDLTTAYSTTLYTQNFTITWASAIANTTYVVSVTITHATYGELTYKQLLVGASTGTATPFSLAWMGDWTFDSTFLIPAFLILFTAGSFSTLNAEVGAILMCIVAILLTYLGWIPIPVGSLVAAFTFAILMALVAHKRRLYTG